MMFIENFQDAADIEPQSVPESPAVECQHEFTAPVRLDPIHIRQSFSAIKSGFKYAGIDGFITVTVSNKGVHFKIENEKTSEIEFSFSALDPELMAQYEDLKNGVRRSDLTENFSRLEVLNRLQKSFAAKILEALDDAQVDFLDKSPALNACKAILDLWYCEEVHMRPPAARQWQHSGMHLN